MSKEYDEEALKKDIHANFGRPYQQCTISIMDTIADPEITFDNNGICNYYYEYKAKENKLVFEKEAGKNKITEIVNTIKQAGKDSKYDCITGVSGGVDSTYLALQAKKLGLRPLIVHFDNGWNSEIAVTNIHKILSKLNFELYTLVVDWNEFKDLQLAYIKASVVDIEAITDHAIITTLYKLALKYNIKYILSGANVVTEAILPPAWIFNKIDHVNIKSIHKKYGTIPLSTFPLFSFPLKKKVQLKKIESINLLNYMPYNKEKVKTIIKAELDWQDYGGKHFESVFTRFYQGYILPHKFQIDKRKAHLSNLIFSRQITKDQAINELKKPIYNRELINEDMTFVLKKFALTATEFEMLMNSPIKKHSDFKTELSIWDRFFILRPLKNIRDKFGK